MFLSLSAFSLIDVSGGQFSGLWKYIKEWQGVYKHFDKDHSGSIDGKELKDALRQFGYKLSPEILTTLERKYGEPSSF